MSSRNVAHCPFYRRRLTALLVCALVLAPVALGWAGLVRAPAVGGVSIDAEGVVSQPTAEDRNRLLAELRTTVKQAPAELARPTELRKISLRRLEAACEEALTNNRQLPDEIKYLAGIQRIQYVLVYPEENDIVLAGPGEGWTLDENGNVVGVTTGRPVIRLDDLLVALRSADAARTAGISCSIDPTAEGLRNLEAYMKRTRQFSRAAVAGMERALGPQQVTVTGVPADTHFARVLVASDYHMKRIAMNLDPSPVAGLPGFLDLMRLKRVRLDNMMPRWWLACNYEPLARSEDGLAWELRGPGVKAMTEDDFHAVGGVVQATGRANPVAQQWADLMTEKYDELSEKVSVFGDLRNLMDLCVVAALIQKEDLLAAAGCSLPLLTNPSSPLTIDTGWPVPKMVPTQCSFVKSGSQYIIAASGGVLVDSWRVASKSEHNAQVEQTRSKAAPPAGQPWWWN